MLEGDTPYGAPRWSRQPVNHIALGCDVSQSPLDWGGLIQTFETPTGVNKKGKKQKKKVPLNNKAVTDLLAIHQVCLRATMTKLQPKAKLARVTWKHDYFAVLFRYAQTHIFCREPTSFLNGAFASTS